MKHALIVCFGVLALVLTAGWTGASQSQPALTLQGLAGSYVGKATSVQGEEQITADLRVAHGKLVGIIRSGDDPIAVVGATISGDRVVLALDMGGLPGTIKGVARDGRIEGEWTLSGMNGTCVLTRTGEAAAAATAPAQSKPRGFATHPRLEVAVPDFPAPGLILDIGGGGEGVIGQLKGKQVVAIDLSKRELDEAPGSPLLKVVMDARDLKFVDRSFPTATVFFTFMYIDPADHEKVFSEVHRVLEPGGRLLVWDAVFPGKRDPSEVTILFPLRAKLPGKEINTGYGVRFREGQGADHFVALAEKAGFQVVSRGNGDGWFFLEMAKAR